MILIRLMGGLGNQMFQYAVGRALAKRHHTELKLDLSLLEKGQEYGEQAIYREYELERTFGITASQASAEEVLRYNPVPQHLVGKVVNRVRRLVALPRTFIEPSRRYDARVLSLPDDYCLVGGYQSPKYFSTVEEELREDFTFRMPLAPKARDLVAEMALVDAIGLNVRRGDYVSNPYYRRILGFVGLAYYERSLRYLADHLKRPHVFIFSDEIDWCQEHMKLDLPHTFVTRDYAPHGSADDLHMLSHCHHFALANSTFAWWGAWLAPAAEKIVIVPANWSADGSLDTTDLVYPHWIRF
jgi:hypothetical protein